MLYGFQLSRGNLKNLCLSTGVLLVLSGCASIHYPLPVTEQGLISEQAAETAPHWTRVRELQNALQRLDPSVDMSEAELVAETAVFYSLQLANDYRLTKPPLLHNTLVNMGIKERGLCIHWTEDLLRKLKSLQLRSLEFHWGVANKTAAFRIEHSTVVATARGQTFETGLVLDPWRDSGLLHFAEVSQDSYTWQRWR